MDSMELMLYLRVPRGECGNGRTREIEDCTFIYQTRPAVSLFRTRGVLSHLRNKWNPILSSPVVKLFLLFLVNSLYITNA